VVQEHAGPVGGACGEREHGLRFRGEQPDDFGFKIPVACEQELVRLARDLDRPLVEAIEHHPSAADGLRAHGERRPVGRPDFDLDGVRVIGAREHLDAELEVQPRLGGLREPVGESCIGD